MKENSDFNNKKERSDTYKEYPYSDVHSHKSGARMGHTYHVCSSWQYLIQRIMDHANKGYCYFSVFNIPARKLDIAEEIDEKIIQKYNCNITKDQRYNLKKKAVANFQYFRFQTFCIVMATPGVSIVDDCESLKDCRKTQIIIEIGSIELQIKTERINNKNKFTVALSERCMIYFKNHFKELAKAKKADLIIRDYNRLNGIPAYSGIIQDKSKLIKYIEFLNKIHKLEIDVSELRIKTYRKIYNNN